MSLRTEVLLYMAARAQLWSETLAPALAEGKCVVLDSWLSSTCAYQGYAGGFGIDNIIKLAHCSLERVWPDMTIILDAELATSSQRLKTTARPHGAKRREYHKKVRDGFLEVAQLHQHFVVVNAAPDIQTVHKHIVDLVQQSEFEPGTTRLKANSISHLHCIEFVYNQAMGLKDIFCQDRAIGTLERAMAAGRVPHAYIFAGPEGVGKFTTAKEWAKLLLCENPSASNGIF